MGTHVSSFNEDLRASLDAFRRIIQALRVNSRAVERDLGISSAQLFALQQLAFSPGASVNELAARTFTHQSSVSVVVRRLVERRLAAKVTAPDDRRRVAIELTDRGRKLLRRAPEPVQERLIAALAGLGDGDRHHLARGLDQVARLLGSGDGPPPMLFEEGGSARRRPPTVLARRQRPAARRMRS